MAEYEALLAGLRACKSLGVQHLVIRGDSQLVVQQYNKEYQCTEESMAKYLLEVRKFEKHFKNLEIKYIPRKDNTVADYLSKLRSSDDSIPQDIILEHLSAPSIGADPDATVAFFKRAPDWTEPFIKYFTNGILPDNRVERNQLLR